MTVLDTVVVVAYFIAITGMGLWVARRVKTSGGYFLGDRKLRWWIMVGQAFGTGTHAEQPVAQTGAVTSLGFATIWYQWKNMLITPFYWLLAPWYRRSDRTTIGEIVEDRYGRPLAFVYTLFAIAYFVFNQGAMLKGAGKVIAVATGSEMITADGVVVLMTLAFIAYSFFGGLVASAYTDFVQSFLIIVLSFLLIPLGLSRVNGFQGMREALPPEFFNVYSEVSGLAAFTIAMLALNGLVGIVAQPHMLSMCATGRTERAGRVGQTYGSMVKRFCTIGWAFTGLIVATIVVQDGITLPEPEAAFGFACRELLGPGVVGLMVAAVLAANMSTCSNFMVNTGALFTRNVYCEYLRRTSSDRELLLVGRLSGLGLTLLGVLFALTVDQVLDAFLFTETIAALMGVMFMGGILWRRANRWGAWTATIASFGVYYALEYFMTCHPPNGESFKTLTLAWSHLLDTWGAPEMWEYLKSGEVKLVYKWQPAPFGWAMLIGFSTLIGVSLITPKEDPVRIAAFFERLRRSSDDEDLKPDGTRGLAADSGKELILMDLPGWLTRERWTHFFRRYREDLIGFALGWLTVAGLIFSAWALMQIGK